MTNWKLTLAYNGAEFHGWQIQPGLPTVQGTLAGALRRITGEAVLPQGAGRTDTGVHALGQVASFSLSAPVPPANLQRALNRILPPSVRILIAEIVPETFHARHSSRGKLYEYRLFERRHRESVGGPAVERVCSPFLAPFVWDCRWPLNLAAMQQAAAYLLGTHDFSAMAASDRTARDHTPPSEGVAGGSRSTSPNPVKTITQAAWTRRDDLLVFQIRGSGFLHHMVRNLVGTLVEVGRGSLAPTDLPRILDSRERAQAGPTAPANGLYLIQVHFPSDPANTSPAAESAAEVLA